MELVLYRHSLHSLSMAAHTRWHGGELHISRKDVGYLFPQRSGMQLQNVFVAKPGDALRFGPVLDVVGMRCATGTTAFPLQEVDMVFPRSIHVLHRSAVTIVSNLPRVQEGLIDMAAPQLCPFANIFHCVCVVAVDKGADVHATDALLRQFQVRLAEFLAGHAVHALPSSCEHVVWPPAPAPQELPLVGMVYMVQSQGVLRRTWFCGEALDSSSPQLVPPPVLLGGALHSGNYVLCCNKTCTYIHHEQPVIRRMLAGHGNDLRFGGVVLANESSSHQQKQSTAEMVARMAAEQGWQGVVVNQEGGGNADTDIMLMCKALEDAGLATVLLLNEFAGEDGRTPSLSETTPEARYIVSTGNNDSVHNLSAVTRCEGFLESLLGAAPGREVRVPLTRVYASTNQLGFHRLACETR